MVLVLMLDRALRLEWGARQALRVIINVRGRSSMMIRPRRPRELGGSWPSMMEQRERSMASFSP